MANHKSAAKRARQSVKKAARNTATKSGVRTFEKKLRTAISAQNKDEAATALKEFSSKIAKAAQKGVIRTQTAARKISRLATQVSKI